MTSRGASPEEALAGLARLISHPLRVRIIDALLDHDASASDLAEEFGEPLGVVAYHVKLLADQGALELRSTRQVRGAIERTYRLAPATRKELAGVREWLKPRRARARRH